MECGTHGGVQHLRGPWTDQCSAPTADPCSSPGSGLISTPLWGPVSHKSPAWGQAAPGRVTPCPTLPRLDTRGLLGQGTSLGPNGSRPRVV